MVVLIGELMKQAERYISEGVHPRIIAEVSYYACHPFRQWWVEGDEREGRSGSLARGCTHTSSPGWVGQGGGERSLLRPSQTSNQVCNPTHQRWLL